jgi:hypothetical protein
MTPTNMAEARRLHAALKDFFAHHVCASPDFRALGRVLTLCETAVRAVDDAYCREKLRLAAEYAAELLSQRDHAKWGRDPVSGAEFLRQQILNALELYASRLYSLDALHESQAVKEKLTWTTRSSIAQS